jgi:hypothetical protein
MVRSLAAAEAINFFDSATLAAKASVDRVIATGVPAVRIH